MAGCGDTRIADRPADTGCSRAGLLDSRVPPEIIFDAGLGDLFTVRNAGHMVDDAAIASLEYAVAKLHVSLLVVLGHERCGAVAMASDGLDALLARATAEIEDSLAAAEAMDTLDERIAEDASIIMASDRVLVWQAREAELEDAADYERRAHRPHDRGTGDPVGGHPVRVAEERLRSSAPATSWNPARWRSLSF